MVLSPDLKEFLQLLKKNDVRFLIIGGFAVAAHGHPRYTKDIDIWCEPVQANATRVVKALQDFGFGSLGLCVSDFVEPEAIIQLGYPPNRIDILTSPDGVEFGVSYDRHIVATLDGLELPFIGLEDLIANKQASGRTQDLADIENLRS